MQFVGGVGLKVFPFCVCISAAAWQGTFWQIAFTKIVKRPVFQDDKINTLWIRGNGEKLTL